MTSYDPDGEYHVIVTYSRGVTDTNLTTRNRDFAQARARNLKARGLVVRITREPLPDGSTPTLPAAAN